MPLDVHMNLIYFLQLSDHQVAWISQVSLSEAEGSLGKAESQQRIADRAFESWLSSVPVEHGGTNVAKRWGKTR
jgi:hypothetical protein